MNKQFNIDFVKIITSFCVLFLLVNCASNQESKENNQSVKPIVAAVNYPLYYFAQRIGGELIQLKYPVPGDVDPAFWIPGDEALSIFQSADIILANGAEYAKWMNNVSLPASRIIYTADSQKEKYILLKQTSTHSHGPDGEHEHESYAFTTWLDVKMAIVQAEAVNNIIASKLPENKEELDRNYTLLKNELLLIHEQLKELSIQFGDQIIIGSHPVYQYLSAAYGLTIHSVHFEPNEIPSTDQWREFDDFLERYPSNLMLWEDDPRPEVKDILAKKGVQVRIFNPCGNQPIHGNFMNIMNMNIQNLQIDQSE